MKTPEIGDVIVTRNGMRWICATSETIREKVGADPDIHYADDPIKAHRVDCGSFMTWKDDETGGYGGSFMEWTVDETGGYAIAEVIPAKTVRPQVHQKPRMHSELIKAWADGAEIEWYEPGTEKWIHIYTPSWWKDTKYRIKTTRELVCNINSDGKISSVGSGNLSLTFNLLGELISAEVIKK